MKKNVNPSFMCVLQWREKFVKVDVKGAPVSVQLKAYKMWFRFSTAYLLATIAEGICSLNAKNRFLTAEEKIDNIFFS